MKKFFISAVLVLAIAAVVLFFASNMVLGAILSGAIGAPVKVGRVSVGLSGAGIYGLVIHNPKGFKEKRLASVPEASVTYDLGAFFKGKVHLKRIKIAMDEVTIERNAEGKFNLMEIKAMKKPERPASETPVPQQPSEPNKPAQPVQLPPLQIDEVVLDLNKARFANDGSVKEFSLGIQGETFHNVTYVPTLVREVVFFILKKVGMSAFPANLDSLLQGVSGEVGTTVNKWLKKLSNF